MKKIGKSVVLLTLSAALVTGCGNTIPDMTEEQQELVAEYAAGVLMKYNKNNEQRLVEVSELTMEEEQEALSEELAAPESTAQQTEDPAKETSDSDSATVVDNTQESAPATIQECLQMDQVVFNYSGYEVTTDYPTDGQELYFIMSATEGNQLLVLKFQAENVTDAEINLDMNQAETRFKIVIDGEEKNALTTMLLNDMTYYQGVIAPGESTELVLVCEIPEETAQTFSSLGLVVKNVDNTATISLD